MREVPFRILRLSKSGRVFRTHRHGLSGSSEIFWVLLELDGTELKAVDNIVIDDFLNHGCVCPPGSR